MSEMRLVSVPEDLITVIEELATDRHQTAVEFIQDALKLAILAANIQRQPNAALMVKTEDELRELLF